MFEGITRQEITDLRRGYPRYVWEDEDGRLFGELPYDEEDEEQDTLDEEQERWWIHLPRRLKDPANDNPGDGDQMLLPRSGDEITIHNLGNRSITKTLVFDYYTWNRALDRMTAAGIFSPA